MALVVAIATLTVHLPAWSQDEPSHEPVPAGPPVVAASGEFRGVHWTFRIRRVAFGAKGDPGICDSMTLAEDAANSNETCSRGVPDERPLVFAGGFSTRTEPNVSHVRGLTSEAIRRVRVKFDDIPPMELETDQGPPSYRLRVFAAFREGIISPDRLRSVEGLDEHGRVIERLSPDGAPDAPLPPGGSGSTASSADSVADPTPYRPNASPHTMVTATPEEVRALGATADHANPSGARPWPWLATIAAGLGLAALGVILHRRRSRQQAPQASSQTGEDRP